jgi:hypothetical protein
MELSLIIHKDKKNQGSYHRSDGLGLVPHFISIAILDVI